MGKEIIIQVQEAQRGLKQDKPKVKHPKTHINQINKNQKHTYTHKQILKSARDKQQITHKGIPIMITADLSIETLQARREWQNILKVMRQKNLQPKLLNPERTHISH